MDDVYQNLGDYNRTNARRVLTVFDNMIADIESNKKFNPIVTELFLRRREEVPKTILLICLTIQIGS